MKFDGYWREKNSSGIPNESGIYCVYTCNYNARDKNVSIDRLIYIGESKQVRERIQGHNLKDNWRGSLRTGQELCFSFASIVQGRERAEAAMIYYHEPEHNIEYKLYFPYGETQVKTFHRNGKLAPNFVVR